jgi:hypothetical protein
MNCIYSTRESTGDLDPNENELSSDNLLIFQNKEQI